MRLYRATQPGPRPGVYPPLPSSNHHPHHIAARHHQVLNKLTEAAFDKCINKPESGIGSSEKQCINATVQKWLDTTQFVQGRFQRKAQAAQEQQQLN